MKTAKAFVVAALVGLTLAAISAPASASRYSRGHHGHHHHSGTRFSFGFYGPGYWGPGYWGRGYWGAYPGYYSYAPPVVVVPSEPRIYVEREAPGVAPSTGQWWYWCASAKGYYPYVSACSEGWQRVPPQPPQQ